jgi:iron(III) transport system permease protein
MDAVAAQPMPQAPLRGGLLARRFFQPYTIVVSIVALAAMALIFVPIAVMFVRILMPDGVLNTQVFIATFAGDRVWIAFANSLIIVVAVNLTAVPVGVLFAWLNFRTDARMGALATFLPLLPLFVPSVAMSIGWMFLGSDRSGFLSFAILNALNAMGFELKVLPIHIFTWPGLLFLYFLELMPVVYVITSAAYRSVDPALEEAARINGSGVAKTFVTVSVPAIKPAILLSMLLVSVLAIGIYSIPAILGSPAKIPTLSVHLVRLLNGEFPPRFDQTAVLSLVMIVIFGSFWLLQQKLNAFGRHAQIGGQGVRPNLIRLPALARVTSRALMLTYILLATVLPLLALLVVAFQPFWKPSIDFSVLSFDNFRDLMGDRRSMQAISNSMMLGIGASFLTLLTAALLMVYAVNSGGIRERVIGILTKVPAAISHLVIAAGMLITFGGAPFYLSQSIIILVLAYFVLYIPKASIAAEAAVRQVGPQLSEASRICGAGSAKTMRKVVLPLMLPGLAAGWALIFASLVGELTASVILAGPHTPVMGYLIMTIYESGTYSQLACLATIIAVLSATTVGLTITFARPKFSNVGPA